MAHHTHQIVKFDLGVISDFNIYASNSFNGRQKLSFICSVDKIRFFVCKILKKLTQHTNNAVFGMRPNETQQVPSTVNLKWVV